MVQVATLFWEDDGTELVRLYNKNVQKYLDCLMELEGRYITPSQYLELTEKGEQVVGDVFGSDLDERIEGIVKGTQFGRLTGTALSQMKAFVYEAACLILVEAREDEETTRKMREYGQQNMLTPLAIGTLGAIHVVQKGIEADLLKFNPEECHSVGCYLKYVGPN